jgi:hypothetical protein
MRIFLISLFHDKIFGFLLKECVPTMLQVITQLMHIYVDHRFDLTLIHQSDIHFTHEFTIFLGFRVIILSRRARTSLFITFLKE